MIAKTTKPKPKNEEKQYIVFNEDGVNFNGFVTIGSLEEILYELEISDNKDIENNRFFELGPEVKVNFSPARLEIIPKSK